MPTKVVMLSDGAEQLLRELLEDVGDGTGAVVDLTGRWHEFSELEDAGMIDSYTEHLQHYTTVRLSGRAFGYFDEKAANDEKTREAKDDERRKRRGDRLFHVFLVVLGWALGLISQWLMGWPKP